ncbi:MAG: flagellar type III secretion system pore protein FliP [Gammaproteobacteria bacterium]|nr:flagellar type III secretion system pore protein FliP [Gammaproteobacteria bacterium]
MNKNTRVMKPYLFILLILITLAPCLGFGADINLPGISIDINNQSDSKPVATAFKILLVMTVLSLAPSIIVVMTSFTRIIIVFSMLRHALGMQQTPPNSVLISLALFLTVFTMLPVFKDMHQHAITPFLDGKIETEEAAEQAMTPLRKFMIRQTREQDLMLMVEISKTEVPKTLDDISNFLLIPAFMLSELKTAFQIGFVIFLPFLMIDMIVASILMSMGMMMVPPMMISLPIKILMFVLIDGWNVVTGALMGSFH